MLNWSARRKVTWGSDEGRCYVYRLVKIVPWFYTVLLILLSHSFQKLWYLKIVWKLYYCQWNCFFFSKISYIQIFFSTICTKSVPRYMVWVFSNKRKITVLNTYISFRSLCRLLSIYLETCTVPFRHAYPIPTVRLQGKADRQNNFIIKKRKEINKKKTEHQKGKIKILKIERRRSLSWSWPRKTRTLKSSRCKVQALFMTRANASMKWRSSCLRVRGEGQGDTTLF